MGSSLRRVSSERATLVADPIVCRRLSPTQRTLQLSSSDVLIRYRGVLPRTLVLTTLFERDFLPTTTVESIGSSALLTQATSIGLELMRARSIQVHQKL
jgi:hypothetical protein